MIVFENVAKRYAGGYTALAGVSFEIRHGELVVLSGHSGAGKSTLFKLIPVIERPTAGRVLINGQDVSHLPKTAIPYLRRNLGLVLQESRLLFDRTVYDNVMLPLVITGHPPRDAVKRVAIARAIVNRPSILIADEPTAPLDPAYAADIAALFRSFNDAGVTVLVSTHDATLFAASRPRRLVLAKGQLVEDSRPTGRPAVEEAA